MLGLVQSWFGQRCSPIGVDFGSDQLRLAQVQKIDGDWRLLAAASEPVPAFARKDPAERWAFFAQAMRDLLARGGFKGRTVILGLPASHMHILHLRVDKMDEESLTHTLYQEAHGKIPLDIRSAVLRHVIAGEVYVDQEPRLEVIVMATKRDNVDQFLAAARKARLDVIGMNTEPSAILDCFTQVYRRGIDQETTNFFVDMGASGTRAILTRGRQILFARGIAVGGDHFTNAVGKEFKQEPEEARKLRLKHAETQPNNPNFIAAPNDSAAKERERAENAIAPAVDKLVEELDLCRRYYEATFPAKPVDRLVFIGGESRHRGLCQRVAKGLGLAAQLGDPMCRMSKISEIGPESGIDRRQPQPGWAVAIGLSMGLGGTENAEAKALVGAGAQENRSQHE